MGTSMYYSMGTIMSYYPGVSASSLGLIMGICWDPSWSNTGLVQRSSNFDSRLSYALADQGFKLATPDTGFFPCWLGNTYQRNMPLQPSRVDRSPWSV